MAVEIPSIRQLMTLVKELEQAVEERFDREDTDVLALQKADEIYKQALKIIHAAMSNQPTGEMPLPLILRLTMIMNHVNIRYADQLQCSLGKTSRLFAEIILFKTVREKRKTLDADKNLLVTSMDNIMHILPEKEVEAFYHFEVALSAIKSLEAVNGLFKTYLMPTLVSEGTDLSGKVTSLDGGAILEPIVSLLEKAFVMYKKEHVSEAFRTCWNWSWYSRLAKSFDEVDTYTEGNYQKWFNKNQDFAFCALEVLMQFINNPETDAEHKRALISSTGEKPSLITFASLKSRVHSFSRVRYLAITYLIPLSVKEEYMEDCIKFLAVRLTQEDRLMVSELIKSAYKDSKNQELWKKTLRELSSSKPREEAAGARKRLSALKDKIKNHGKFQQQSNTGYSTPFDQPAKTEKIEDLEKEALHLEESAICLENNASFIESVLAES